MREIPADVLTLLKSRSMVGANKPAHKLTVGGVSNLAPPDPGAIEVWDADDLNNVRSNLSGSYIQMADIDLSGYASWTPIGNNATPFTGKYDGGGFTISGLAISTTASKIGLFGVAVAATDADNSFQNVNLTGVSITATNNDYTGALVGYHCKGNIVNCHSAGTISVLHGDEVGGLIGGIETDYYSDSDAVCSVSDCSSSVSISAHLEGYGNNNFCGDCGGFIGYCSNCTNDIHIYKCHATGNIIYHVDTVRKAGLSRCGGFGGFVCDGVTVEQCYATGNVSTGWSCGGFYGHVGYSLTKNCYCRGDIVIPDGYDEYTGFNDNGGFAGGVQGDNLIENCYCAGAVGGLTWQEKSMAGFIPFSVDYAAYTNCYYDYTLCPLPDDQVPSKTTAEMQTQGTFAGWNFSDIWTISPGENDGYPRFREAVEIKVKSISIDRSKGMASSCNIALDNKGGVYSPDGTGDWAGVLMPNVQVEIEQGYGTNLVKTFTGYVDNVEMTTFPQELRLTCRDKSKLALDRIVTNDVDGGHYVKFANTTVEAAFIKLAELCGLTTGTVEETGMLLTSKMFSWESYADAFSWLAELSGFEWHVDEMGLIHFVRDATPENPEAAYVFREGEDIISLGYTISDTDLYYEAVVYGQDAEGNVIKASAQFGAPLTYKLFSQKVLKIDAQEADTVAKCQEIADRAVALMLCRARVVDFAAVAVPWLQIGDFIQVIETSSTISELYRITDMAFNQDPNGFTMSIRCYWYGAVSE